MANYGTFTILSAVECGLAVLFWVVSFATRGWLVGNTLQGDVDIGLFKTSVSVGSQELVVDTSSFLPDVSSELDVTIGLMATGGAFALISLGLLVVTILKKEKILFVAFAVTSALSGILTLVGAILFKVNYDLDSNVDVGYSWYLAVLAYVFQWSSFGSLGAAVRRGEIAFNGGFNSMR
ncbi:unnamed protein product [Lymnaea stagnalis]|uniref:Uncharacterized protein n=1 Tax=Lymnaea stagnalis TaxID=6523 RepID=A0AAV2IV10_LYMST